MIKSNLIYNKKTDKGFESLYRSADKIDEAPLDVSYLSESSKSVNEENIESNLSTILSQPFNHQLNDMQTPSIQVNNFASEKNATTSSTAIPTSVEPMKDMETPCLPKEKNVNEKFMWKIEAQIAALKSFVNCEISTLNEKVSSYTENFNKLSKKIEEYQNKYYKSLEENIDFFKKELKSKDELIRSLVDKQTEALDTVKAKSISDNSNNIEFTKHEESHTKNER